MDSGTGILDAGTSLSATNVTGMHVFRKKYAGVPGIPMVSPRYKSLYYCVLYTYMFAAGPTNTIIRVVLLESRKFQQLD